MRRDDCGGDHHGRVTRKASQDHDAEYADSPPDLPFRCEQVTSRLGPRACEPEAIDQAVAEVVGSGDHRPDDDTERDHGDNELRGDRERALDDFDPDELDDDLTRQ